MRYSIISFDLQGTLSESAFSDTFWLDLLPQLYSEKYRISVDESKRELKALFRQVGRYDKRYYSFDYWLKFLDVDLKWEELIQRVEIRPQLISEMRDLVLKLQSPLLLFSATTHTFINHELGELKSAFSWVISAIDDLKFAGKPPAAYRQIASMLGVFPNEILHIGDDLLMDVENARSAGWDAFHMNPKINIEKNINQLEVIL